MMASLSSPNVVKSLKVFSESLEDLTFNSKPIIDELTRFANTYRAELAPKITQKLEGHILEVRPEWKLPALYLLDSIVKNLKGEYLTLFSTNIVRVFCHCFEKLVDPEARKSLYKLRQTWPQYFPNRKLAAIDVHVKALDPNWPVTAVDKDPPSPTIFVNPKFLEVRKSGDASEQSSSQKNNTNNTDQTKAHHNDETKNGKHETKSSKSTDSPPKVAASPPVRDPRKVKGKMSIQEKRRKLLQEKQSQRIKQQKAMGLSADKRLKVQKTRSGHSHTPPGSRGPSPLATQVVRARSASPKTAAARKSASPPTFLSQPNHVEEKSGTKSEEGVPPAVKRVKLDVISSLSNSTIPEVSSESEAELVIDVPERDEPSENEEKEETKPLKKSQLELDDIPPELLPKHQELILKQIETQLQSGNLTSDQHDTLVKQLEQLYELQRLKDEDSGNDRIQSSHRVPPAPPHTDTKTQPSKDEQQTVEQSSERLTETNRPDGTKAFSSKEFISLSDSKSDSVFFVDTSGSVDKLDNHLGSAHRGGRPPPRSFRGRPQHHRSFEREERYYTGPHPYGGGHFRGDPRAPYRPRRGPPFYPRRTREDHPYDGPDVPPPHIGPGRGSGRILRGQHPPPPHWHEPPRQGGGFGGAPPPLAGGPPPQVDVSKLFSKLVDFGMIGESESSSLSSSGSSQRPKPEPRIDTQDSQPITAPLKLPTLSFTAATLKQKYTALVSLLHVGEQCSSCGLRFADRSHESYGKHLDWHYNLNRMESEGQQTTSRNWFIHPEDWLKFEELSEDSLLAELRFKPSQTEDEEQPSASSIVETVSSCQVLPGEGNEVCSTCHEPLEQFWEEEQEEWHFKEAIRSSSGKLYHTFCFEDVKEEDFNTSNDSMQLSIKEEQT